MLNIKLELPEGFLEEEERDGYLVSAEMKKIWAVELDLLNEFMRVCKEHDIRWFADGGTILGAIRHNGMIPWDDDIDVCMYREDYEKLCEIAPAAFKAPYFFQTEETDRGSMRGHAQLRNSSTTGMLKMEDKRHVLYNQGIFLDIFPLDDLPENKEERAHYMSDCFKTLLDAREYTYFWENMYRRTGLKGFVKNIITTLRHVYDFKNPIYEDFKKKCVKYQNTNTPLFGKVMFRYREKLVLKKAWFSDVTYHKFEMLEIPLPNGYEDFLNQFYGNWKEFVIGGGAHGGVFFDPEKSYLEYVHEDRYDRFIKKVDRRRG